MANLGPQLLYTILSNVLPFFFGLHLGWLAPFENALRSDLSPLKHGLSDDEVSWLASLPTISILLSAPFFGFLLQHLGRKTALLIASVPNILVFGILLLTDTILCAYIARFISGFVSAGALIVTPLYVCECVEEKRRGFLGGQSAFFMNIGVLVALLLGQYGNYHLFSWFGVISSGVFLFSFLSLPETPVYLASIEKFADAKGSLRKLGRSAEDVDKELEIISVSLKATESVKNVGFMEVVRDRGLRQGLVIVLVVLCTQQLSGISAVCAYLVKILVEVDPHDDDNIQIAAIILFLQLIGSIIAPILLNFCGRKTILIISGFIMSGALASFSSMLYLEITYAHAPSIALALYIIAYACGFGSVPFVLLPEILLPESRGVAAAVAGVVVSIAVFCVTKFFYLVSSIISLGGTFAIFSFFTALGTLFVCFCMFETRGKTAVEIYEKLKGVTSGRGTRAKGYGTEA